MAGREKYESPVNEKKISNTATVSFNSLKRRIYFTRLRAIFTQR